MQADDGTAKRHETRSRIDHRTGKRVFIHDASFWRAHVEERKNGRGSSNRCTRTARSAVLRLAHFVAGCSGWKGARERRRERGEAKVAFLEVPIERARHEAALSPIEVSLGPAVRIRLAVRVLRLVLARVERAAQL
jgi:hypothetical protein